MFGQLLGAAEFPFVAWGSARAAGVWSETHFEDLVMLWCHQEVRMPVPMKFDTFPPEFS